MGYFEDSEARQQRIGKREGVDAMIDTESVSDVGPLMPTGGWTTEGQGAVDANAQGTRSWQDIAQRQNETGNQKLFDGYMGIIQTAKNDIALNNQNKMIAGSAMLQSAYDNPNGMSDRALSASLSEAVGQPIYGCQILRGLKGEEEHLNGQAAVYGLVQDPTTGKQNISVVGLIDQKSQLSMLQGANLGNRTLGLRKQLYNGISKSYTPEQMSNMGFMNPNDIQAVGQTNIRGSLTNRLLGRPQQRSSISWFSADGNGGGSRGEVNGRTGERWEEDWGTRKNAEQARIADLAAEVADAKSGNRMKIEQMKEQGKNERLDKKIAEGKESRKETREERKQSQYENAISTREYRDREHIRKMRAEKLKGSLSESPKYTDEQISAEEKRLADEREAYKARLKNQYGIKDDVQDQGQATSEKKDNGGDGSSVQYKQGDEQEINGVKMRLVPSSKDSSKLVWKRI